MRRARGYYYSRIEAARRYYRMKMAGELKFDKEGNEKDDGGGAFAPEFDPREQRTVPP